MLIDQFIDNELFTHHFQPVHNILDAQCIGFEALLRSNEFPNPEFAFEFAKLSDRLYDLDTASIEAAMTTFRKTNIDQADTLLFINVLPSKLINQQFPAFIYHTLHFYQFIPQQIALEISESEQMD